MKERRKILSDTAPDLILSRNQILGIDDFVQAVEGLNIAPFDIDKCFLADLAVVVTRVWEAYTVDGEGNCCFRVFEITHVDHYFEQEFQYFLLGTKNPSKKKYLKR